MASDGQLAKKGHEMDHAAGKWMMEEDHTIIAKFKYGMKKFETVEREINATKRKPVDMVVRWGLNFAATRIFGIVKHWPATSMLGI